MPPNKICKTVHQYNREPVCDGDMQKLLDVAEDYRKVKNYVYGRFGGISSLSKIYPGYTIQNEMTASGYRETLGMPAVYFYLAVFDALGDIKSQWTRTKSKLVKLVNKNEGFTGEEKHYLRFCLKVSNVFEAILNQKPVELPAKVNKQYCKLAEQVDKKKLHRYLCRQVRKYHVKLYTDTADVFAIAERAYRYADHGIYISIKEKRKRIFISLTDHNQYKCQLRIKLYPKENRIEIKVPVNVSVRHHADYLKQVGAAVGFYTMLTTDEGHRYGEELGEYQSNYSDWIREQNNIYRRNKEDNPGRKKYFAKKRRDVKDELMRIEYFQNNLGTSANVAKAKQALKSIKGLETRKYKPRKYDELFENYALKDRNREKAVENIKNNYKVVQAVKDIGGEDIMTEERKYTPYDGKENDWLTFARQQAEFYRNAGQYISNLRIMIQEIDLEIGDILQETEVANCNVAQGYKVFKRLKELRLERKAKSQELDCLYALTDYIDCDALADTCEDCLAEVKEIMNVKDESVAMNVQDVGDESKLVQVIDTMQDMVS